jgi:hypothetical protein
MAIGRYQTADGHSAALVERWNGSSWTIGPNPTGGLGVACPADNECIAVGVDADGHSLAERWDGTSWSVQPTPNPLVEDGGGPTPANTILDQVSCTSPTNCVAAGHYDTLRGYDSGVIESWDGSSWTLPSTPALPTDPFDAVSCGSASSCTAVGYDTLFDDRLVDAWHWDRTSWTKQAPVSSSSNATGLSGIACPTSTSCIAVGQHTQYPDSTDHPETDEGTFAESWDGSSWTAESTPDDTGSLSMAELDGISCANAVYCVAVGSDYSSQPLIAARRATTRPVVTTSAASGIGATTATLHGSVNPEGSAITYCAFFWGPTSAYGHSAPCSALPGSGSRAVQVRAKISGLRMGSTYHYRLLAGTAADPEAGGDWAFSTPSSGTLTFGNASVGVGLQALGANYNKVNPYALPQSGAVSRLMVYLQPTRTTGQQLLEGDVYAGSGSGPGALLGVTQWRRFSSDEPAQWYGLAFTTPLHLAAGRYWIGIENGGTSGVTGYRFDVVPGGSRYRAPDPFSSGPEDPFGPVYTVDDEQMSLYAEYVPDAASATRAARALPTAR